MSNPYKVVYSLLSASSSLSSIITAPDNVKKIFPNQVPQKYALPAIVVDVVSTIPSDTKDGASAFDTIRVQVTSIATTKDIVEQIGVLVRSLLDFVNHQTISSAVVNYIKFAGENDLVNTMSGQDGLYLKYQEFIITINK